MLQINPYFIFDGNAQAALDFYSDAFDVNVKEIMTFASMPESDEFHVPAELKNRIMHAVIEIDGNQLMFSDTMPGMPYTKGNDIGLAIIDTDRTLLQARFTKLAVGGTIVMPLEPTFWTPLYGQVKDQFGTDWQFNLVVSEE